MIKRALLFASILVSLWSFALATMSPAATNISGPISTSTWTVAGSPYVITATGASVPSGQVLTLDPGVTVKFDTDTSA